MPEPTVPEDQAKIHEPPAPIESPTAPGKETSELPQQGDIVSRYLDTKRPFEEARHRLIEELDKIGWDSMMFGDQVYARLTAGEPEVWNERRGNGHLSEGDYVKRRYEQARSGVFETPDKKRIKVFIRSEWSNREKVVRKGSEDVDENEPTNEDKQELPHGTEYEIKQRYGGQRFTPHITIEDLSGSSTVIDGSSVEVRDGKSTFRVDKHNFVGWTYGSEYMYDASPPRRDPLVSARADLDYLLEHADELKLVEPEGQGAQTPTSS